MKKLYAVLFSLAVAAFLTNVSIAQEHPGATHEHPGAGEHEHKEHPGTTHEEEHPGKKEMLPAADIIKAINDHISKVAEANGGVYPLTDTEEGKELKLKLVKVHEGRVSYIAKDDAYFACTDFITEDGLNSYDVDFWMKKSAEGTLEVYQTKIHKKDGNPRFTYKDDEICPVK